MLAALISNETVVNVIEYDPNAEYVPDEGVDIVGLDVFAGIGWTYRNGEFIPPPSSSLFANPDNIVADSVASSLVEYHNTYDNAPTEVIFDVNGAQTTVPLIDGVAQLEVIAQHPGDILVTVDDLSVTITATEV